MVIVRVIITFVHQSECEEAERRGESKLSPVLLAPHWGMGAHVTHKRIRSLGAHMTLRRIRSLSAHVTHRRIQSLGAHVTHRRIPVPESS